MGQASSKPSWAVSGSPTWEIAELFPTQGAFGSVREHGNKAEQSVQIETA